MRNPPNTLQPTSTSHYMGAIAFSQSKHQSSSDSGPCCSMHIQNLMWDRGI